MDGKATAIRRLGGYQTPSKHLFGHVRARISITVIPEGIPIAGGDRVERFGYAPDMLGAVKFTFFQFPAFL